MDLFVKTKMRKMEFSPIILKDARPFRLQYPSLRREDLHCLDDKKLLNDTIIEFYLKYIFNEKLTRDLQEKTFICNTFFYPKVRQELDDINKNEVVEKWLKGIDLFTKDFIVIPVNVESPRMQHWYLVIICFLSKIKKTPLHPAKKPSDSQVRDKRPCILFFDSAYAGDTLDSKKLEVAKNLKNFLKILSLRTYKYEAPDWKDLSFFNVRCPQQHNLYDCGMFLLQFAESFFQTQIEVFEDPINVTHWFDQSMITEKRRQIKEIIQRMQR